METVPVAVDGVMETDMPSLTGKHADGDHDGVVEESAESKSMRGDVVTKATSEMGRPEMTIDTCCVVTTVTHVGVDPAKILMGKEVMGVML